MPAAKSSKELLNTEQILQAVLVADSFNENFRPLTFDTPRCLLPLANTPMIEYSLESLALSGVQEILVICCAHSEQIKEYISKSRWGKSTNPLVKTIVSQELRSTGDALRDLDAKQLIQSDFILMSADVVSNLNLSKVLEDHRQRKITDKNSIMTVVCKQASMKHPTRSKSEESVFVLDAKTNECLRYEPFPRFTSSNNVIFCPSLFKSHPEVLIRNDLIDCQIDICSVEVPALFTENFDYQDVRKDFLSGILESELLGKTVYTHIIDEGYAAHVSTLRMYHSVSKDVISRWAYPLSPDNFSHDDEIHTHNIRNIYKGSAVSLDRSCSLTQSVVVGCGSVIQGNSKVSNSVIGRNCTIGSNVTIMNSYIMNNAVIGNDCIIDQSIIGSDVTLLDKVQLSSGCVIESNVMIGPSVLLDPRTKVSQRKQIDEFSTTDEDTDNGSPACDYDTQSLGLQTTGYLFTPEPLDDEYEEKNLKRGNLDYESPTEYTEDDADTSAYEEDQVDAYNTEDENDWVKEVEQTLQRAFEDNHTTDIAVLELNTLKMAMNITFKDLRQVVLPCILSQIPLASTVDICSKIVRKWCPILLKFTHSDEDQIDCLDIITQHLVNSAAHLIPRMPIIIKILYDIDLVEEDPILEWFATVNPVGPLKKVKESAKPFIIWLSEADEDDSDEDSD